MVKCDQLLLFILIFSVHTLVDMKTYSDDEYLEQARLITDRFLYYGTQDKQEWKLEKGSVSTGGFRYKPPTPSPLRRSVIGQPAHSTRPVPAVVRAEYGPFCWEGWSYKRKTPVEIDGPWPDRIEFFFNLLNVGIYSICL